jgi:hypothetical protein
MYRGIATWFDLCSKRRRDIVPSTDLRNLPNYHIYLKLMIDGAPSKAFSGVTLQAGRGYKRASEPAEEADDGSRKPSFPP